MRRKFSSFLGRNLKIAAGASGLLFFGGIAFAHPHDNDPNYDNARDGHSHSNGYVHENGIGADPDNDTNPATHTGAISLLGDAAEAADDPPYAVITFEAPPGSHGDTIKKAYQEEYGVTFYPEVTRQLCKGQRHFNYNSWCTYEAAPSGEYAAAYMDYLNRPLIIEFERPVCVVTMAIYPTGGKEGEPFELTIEGWAEDETALETADIEFEWTRDTVRWRHMAGAYYLDRPASKIAVSMKSQDAAEKKETLRFLIDDLAIVENGCDEALAEIKSREDSGAEDATEGEETEGVTEADVTAPVLSVSTAE